MVIPHKMTVNEQLQDIQITHSHYVERYKSYEVNRIQKILNQANAEIKAKLLSADITVFTRRRYESLLKSIEEIEKSFDYTGTLRTDLKDFGQTEVNFQHRNVSSVVNNLDGIDIDFKLPSRSAVWSIANADPLMMIDGTTVDLSQFLKGISNKRLDVIRNTLRQGYITGQSSAEMSRSLIGTANVPGTIGVTRNTADIIVRTSLNHLQSSAKKQFSVENSQYIKGYEWVSVLDSKTTPVCQDRDGKSWIYDPEEREKFTGRLLPGEVHTPAHYRCRSVETFITRSYKELGLDIEEIPPPSRAAMNGTAPGGTTYNQWLSRQPASIQKDVLGATRYEMYRTGDIKLDSFHANNGELLTLDQLQNKGYTIPDEFLRYVR